MKNRIVILWVVYFIIFNLILSLINYLMSEDFNITRQFIMSAIASTLFSIGIHFYLKRNTVIKK